MTDYEEMVEGTSFRYRKTEPKVWRLERKTDAGLWLDSAREFSSLAEARNWVYFHFRLLQRGVHE